MARLTPAATWLLLGSLSAIPACIGNGEDAPDVLARTFYAPTPTATAPAALTPQPTDEARTGGPAIVTGPAIAKPLVLPEASTYREILASDLRADETWALSLGPRFRIAVEVDGKKLQAHVYPYARVHFPAPFVYVPPGQVYADGTRVRAGWLRVPVGVLYRLERAGLPSREEAITATS